MNFESVFNNFIPSCCNICKRITYNSHICSYCKDSLEINRIKRCKTCFKPLEDVSWDYCLNCQEDKFIFSSLRYLWEYKRTPSLFIKNLKYEKSLFLLNYAKKLLLKKYQDFYEEEYHDLLIPAPSSKRSIYKRGYLHTYFLLDEIYRFLKKINGKTKIIKYKTFPKQYYRKSELSFTKRKKFINYQLDINYNLLKNKRILFLDDMITTGSTALNIFSIVKNYDIRSFDVLTLGVATDFYENYEKLVGV